MRDYKYIEQLLERYWECQTTLEEESILRTFFAQEEIPMHLLPYRQLFLAQKEEKETTLGKDFEERIMAIIDKEEPVEARIIPFSMRMRPFYRAAAVVAILITLGTAAEKALEPSDAPYPSQVAFEEIKKEGPSVAINDSVRKDSSSIRQQSLPAIMK